MRKYAEGEMQTYDAVCVLLMALIREEDYTFLYFQILGMMLGGCLGMLANRIEYEDEVVSMSLVSLVCYGL